MQSYKTCLYITITSLLLLGSCKKESSSNQGVAGRYRIVYNSGSDTLPQYYILNEDNTFDNLEQSNQQAHTIRHGVYQTDESTIILSITAPYTYLLVKTGDTVKFIGSTTTPESSFPNLVLVKDAAAPSA